MDIDFFLLSANPAESQSWGLLPFLSELYGSPPRLIISLASPLLCGNYSQSCHHFYKDHCSFSFPFPTICSLSFLAIPHVLLSIFNFFIPLLMFSCSLPSCYPNPLSLHFGENFTISQWEEPGFSSFSR